MKRIVELFCHLGFAVLVSLSLCAYAESLVVQERFLGFDPYARPPFEETYLLDSSAFLPDLIHELGEAQRTVYLDFYIIGGPEFDLVVDLMNEKMQDGVDVRILLDRGLGNIAAHTRYMKASAQRIVDYGIPFYLTSDQKFGSDEYGRPYKVGTVDHNKYVVIDGHVAYIGSANPIPSMDHFFDLMFLVKGKAVRRLHNQFLFDFANAERRDRGLSCDTKQCNEPWLHTNEPSFQRIRIFSNGLCRVEVKNRLIELIDASQGQIDIMMQELSHVPEVMDAFKRARERGVKIRVLVGPTDPTDVLEGFIGAALLPKGITVARGTYALEQMGAEIRVFHLRPGASMLHPKVLVFDETILFGGSTNLTEGGLERVYETNIEIHASEGSAVSQMNFLFETEWAAASAYKDFGAFSRFIQYFMDEGLNHPSK